MNTTTDKDRGLTPEIRAEKAREFFDKAVADNQEIIDGIMDQAFLGRKEPVNANDAIGELRTTMHTQLDEALQSDPAEQARKVLRAFNAAMAGLNKWSVIALSSGSPVMHLANRPEELLAITGPRSADNTEQAGGGITPSDKLTAVYDWMREFLDENKKTFQSLDVETARKTAAEEGKEKTIPSITDNGWDSNFNAAMNDRYLEKPNFMQFAKDTDDLMIEQLRLIGGLPKPEQDKARRGLQESARSIMQMTDRKVDGLTDGNVQLTIPSMPAILHDTPKLSIISSGLKNDGCAKSTSPPELGV